MRKMLLSVTAIAVLALPGVAQARHGADDPAGHVRHASHVHHHHHHAVRHAADDGPNHR
jgi:hypothetical protein